MHHKAGLTGDHLSLSWSGVSGVVEPHARASENLDALIMQAMTRGKNG